MSENLPRVETVVDDLYSLPPADFVSHRAAYVAQFKKAGDKAGASRIGALRKPTVVAWLVNTLARRDESALAELFDLGEQLERAQQRGDGPRLRELSTARSTSIRTLTDRAVSLGRDLGATVGDNAAREVSNTLNAAMADAEIRDRVRAGRTVVAETYSGFGPALLSIVPDSPDDDDAAEDDPVSPEVEDDRQKTDEAERNRLLAELESAESDLDTARTEVDEAQADTERKASELRSAAAEVERIEAELEAAGARAQAAREAHEASVVQAESTAAALEAARVRVAEARSALDSLT
ncbi:MAG: hypothetical protein QME72_03185 [Rhodococcus sp. (in: high G+C Gram-positive bacteria)]|nr:hypothetical protein [Rhodococcus sp. (in: high G+C Gram-positive bacteria)]MDI6626705.1 hypothetical protein [Rhodococcus sp. (in: high G+C Gram-positive bacteria)]